ncbi:MAG: PQQ-binding-like beta-propeller repeat protein [Pseudomonadales bacterium]|jgi:polyvinyl alcohol dehydrogenase (cytochrome)|nr:PQQ-binding-like beta-propeller repeat protein [Pseudomonadales bacterium]MDP6828176.1 PQQ-binding-like beta-propeller repeat protein [Pseudomonadales bacterium]
MTAVVLTASSVLAHTTECTQQPGFRQLLHSGWGNGVENKRFQVHSDINLSNVRHLQLEWVFALDDDMSPHSYPVITEDTVFIGTSVGNLYALERESGCTRWQFGAGEPIRTGITHGRLGGRDLLFFGTFQGNVFAVDGVTGQLVWKQDVKDHPYVMVTGTPTYHDGELFVPISSGEVALAISPFYGCCKFRGSLVSLDAATGATNWRTHIIREQPKVIGRHFIFVEEWGPSGAPVWSSPTVDTERGLVYVGTGENYTHPATATSDAIIAFYTNTGEIVWTQQYTRGDAFNMACGLPYFNANCPDDSGPDLDFGAPPVLSITSTGNAILLAGQKSGGVYGIDPASGQRIWETQYGRGGMLGGVHWGMAVNERLGLLFAPISDVPTGPGFTDEADPGLHALDITTGEARWSAPNSGNCEGREKCRSGLSAAITATDDLVFASALDGYVHAYDAETGDIVWSYDTWREFDALNGVTARGGSIDVHGPAIAGKWMYVQSGYGSFGQQGGNVLLAFKVGPVHNGESHE